MPPMRIVDPTCQRPLADTLEVQRAEEHRRHEPERPVDRGADERQAQRALALALASAARPSTSHATIGRTSRSPQMLADDERERRRRPRPATRLLRLVGLAGRATGGRRRAAGRRRARRAPFATIAANDVRRVVRPASAAPSASSTGARSTSGATLPAADASTVMARKGWPARPPQRAGSAPFVRYVTPRRRAAAGCPAAGARARRPGAPGTPPAPSAIDAGSGAGARAAPAAGLRRKRAASGRERVAHVPAGGRPPTPATTDCVQSIDRRRLDDVARHPELVRAPGRRPGRGAGGGGGPAARGRGRPPSARPAAAGGRGSGGTAGTA